jgi:hypothetical protein
MNSATSAVSIDAPAPAVYDFVSKMENLPAWAVDFVLTPAPGIESTAFARVLPRGPGAEFVFTFYQSPGMPDDAFAGQQAALRKELAVLKSRLESRR